MASLQTMQLQDRLQGAESRRMAAGSPFAPSSAAKRSDGRQQTRAPGGGSSTVQTDESTSSMDSTPSIFLDTRTSSADAPGAARSAPHPSPDLLARISPPQMRGVSLFHISQAREEAAASNRSRLIQSVVSAARVSNSAAASTHALHSTGQARRTATARAELNARMAAAAIRRKEALLASAATARQHVRLVQARVMGNRKAATRVQQWWRALHTHACNTASQSSSDGAASAPMSPDDAMLRVHFSPLQSPARVHVSPALQGSGEAAAMHSLGAMPELDLGGGVADSTPLRTSSGAGGLEAASPNSRATSAALDAMAVSSDATQRIQATQAVRRVFQSKGAQRATRVLQLVLSGRYAAGHPDGLPPVTSPTAPAANMPLASLSLALQPAATAVGSHGPASFSSDAPAYASFDDCAAVLQERSAVSAAMHFAKLVKLAYAKLAAVVGYAAAGTGGGSTQDSHAYSGKASDPASDASLRPAIAQSPRTLLASLLLAWFPGDILGAAQPNAANGEQGGSDERRDAEQRLSEAARVMLEALDQLCAAVQSMAPASHDTPVPTPTLDDAPGVKPDEYAALLERFSGTHDAAHVETLLRCTLLKPRDVAALPRRAVLLLHRVLAFNACHVEYMDQYMVWKLGDAARMAQSLVQPYAQALRQSWHYQRKMLLGEPSAAAEMKPRTSSVDPPTAVGPIEPAAGVEGSALMQPDWASLPVPVDDGGAAHLLRRGVPPVPLQATGGEGSSVDISSLHGTAVVFLFPMTGRPGAALPAGWDDIPGARGCTPQACAFRDLHRDLKAAGTTHVFGVSTQSPLAQSEAAARLHLPYSLLSDSQLRLTGALSLPTFTADDSVYLKRMTLVIMNGRIVHVRYPVFPPSDDAKAVLQWLRENASSVASAAASPVSQASPGQRPLSGGVVAYHQLHSAVQSQLAIMDGQLRRLLGARGATRWVQHITQRTAEQWAEENHGQSVPANPAASPRAEAGALVRPPAVPRQRPSARPGAQDSAAAPPPQEPKRDDTELPRSAKRGPSMALVKQVMSNAGLAHSVMVDPDFELPAPPAPPGSQLQDMAQGASIESDTLGVLLQLVQVQPPLADGGSDEQAADDAALSAAARHMAMAMSLAQGSSGDNQRIITAGVRTNWRWGVAKAQQDTLRSGRSNMPSSKLQYAAYWGDVLSLAVSEDGETGAGVITEAIQSVLAAIQTLVPHRTDLHDEMKRSFDLPTTRRMLAARAMAAEDWWRLISALVSQLAQLEAPARASEGELWLGGVHSVFLQLGARAAPTDEVPHALIQPPARALLPVVLAWMHWRVALVQSDISNFQLSTLRPYLLRGGRGAEYERKQWAAALADRQVSADGVTGWVRQEALRMIEKLPTSPSNTAAEAVVRRIAATRQLAGDSDLSRVCLLRDGMLSLIQLPYPVSQLAAAAAEAYSLDVGGRVSVDRLRAAGAELGAEAAQGIFFPGTLSHDAKTLTDGQNTVQRTALVASLAMILEQYVSQLPRAVASSEDTVTVQNLQEQVHAWLLDDDLRLPDLRAAALQLVQRRASSSGRLRVDAQQHPSHIKRLFALVDSAVSYEHALYSLCAQRVVGALRHAVTAALQMQIPPGGSMNSADQNVFWLPYIAPPTESVSVCVPAVCAKELLALAARLASIARHSNAVHGALYQTALQQLVGGAIQHHTANDQLRARTQRRPEADVSSSDDDEM